MIVLVTGGRHYSGTGLAAELIRLHIDEDPIELVIHGGAHGADSVADQWARDMEIDVEVFEADWDTHGKKAGPLRNQAIVDRIVGLKESKKLGDFDVCVVAAPGGRGTADCVMRANRAGLRVNEVE